MHPSPRNALFSLVPPFLPEPSDCSLLFASSFVGSGFFGASSAHSSTKPMMCI